MTNTWLGLADDTVTCPAVDADLRDTYLGYFIDTGFMSPPPGEGRTRMPATEFSVQK